MTAGARQEGNVPRTASQSSQASEPPVRVAEAPPGAASSHPPPGPRRRWTRNRILLLALAVLVVAAGVAFWAVRAGRKGDGFKYETAAVDRGSLVAKVTATGTLSALVTVQVGSQVSGTIASLHADFNSPVKKGDVIATIDPQLFQAAVAQARANVVAAEGNLARAEAQAVDAQRQLARQRELDQRKLVAKADVDTAESNADAAAASVKAARGSLAQARAALSQAQVNFAYTKIVSPTSGVVISRNVDVGQTVAASLQAPTLFVIAEDLGKMQVDTNVAESDVGRLQPDTPATFTVDAYPGKVFKGSVRQVRNAPQTVQNVVTYDAVVDVANPDLLLKPGMTATVTFVYAERENALRVPNAALRFRPPRGMIPRKADAGGERGGHGPRGAAEDGAPRAQQLREADGSKTVWVLRAGKPERVRIRTGISDGTSTEVVEGGLAPGDLVITDATGSSDSGDRPRGGPGPGGMRIF
jgi:HlyD family secretion protein